MAIPQIFPVNLWLCRGKYDGPEPQRLAVLKYAAILGVSHVDVELKVASYFFAGSNDQ